MLTSSTMQETAAVHSNDSKNDPASLLEHLTTESQNEASQGFDTKSALEIARIINHEDAKVASAVKKAIPEIAQVINHAANSLRDGGRIIYIGAGSSGRIAALDASECPPTYSTMPGQVQYIMAGGPKALASAVEVNEDSEELGQRDIARRRPTRKDVVIGLSASGRTPYVVAAVAYARARGAYTAAVTCNHETPLAAAANIAIVAEVGPEVVSGSTRMKAGTAQKMILNMITTGAMTRLGYVYENLMVNVHGSRSPPCEIGRQCASRHRGQRARRILGRVQSILPFVRYFAGFSGFAGAKYEASAQIARIPPITASEIGMGTSIQCATSILKAMKAKRAPSP
jgi:N-acetylmuramic acid 6-phosphate etherase